MQATHPELKSYLDQNQYEQVPNLYLYSQSVRFIQNISKDKLQENVAKTMLQNVIEYFDGLAVTPEHQFQIIHEEVNMVLSIDQLKQDGILIDYYPLTHLY